MPDPTEKTGTVLPAGRRTGLRQWRSRRARASLLLGVLCFAGMQLGMGVYIDSRHPELRDAEYGQKLARLRSRLAETPGRPLIVFLGSSRSELGFRPEVLPTLRVAGEPAVVFNFALSGSGPIMELMCLRRLLAAGIHPTQLIVEVLPPLLHQEGEWAEEHWLPVDRLGVTDLFLLRHYWQHPWSSSVEGLASRLVPWFSNRYAIMTRCAPCWLTWDMRQDDWGALDRSGWLPYRQEAVDAEEYRRGLEFARGQYAADLKRFHISDAPDRALHELLRLCRVKHIAVTLVLMPEGRAFQSWYPPAARAEIERYLARVGAEHGVALVDARLWMEDNAFCDGHHLLPRGAAVFTQRFGQEVLQPLLEGKTAFARRW
jgi:hypothetical protein